METSLNCFIRPLILADKSFLWEMLYQAIYVPANHTPPPQNIINHPELVKYVYGWGRPNDHGFIAIDTTNSQPVGAVWIRLLTGGNKGYGYVDDATPELSIAVLPNYRGNGLGTRLLTHILEFSMVRYLSISLSVSETNPALRLYQRLGFEIVGRCGTSLTMIKRFD
jgi:ribosomal protein S18 acetylase RimI-like enzyme